MIGKISVSLRCEHPASALSSLVVEENIPNFSIAVKASYMNLVYTLRRIGAPILS